MRLHAVYGVVIDLCYQHGGAIHNSPKWISGWISDMGPAAVRNAIAELIALGKLLIDEDGNLTEKRARNEAKTREELRENAAENGKKGGIKSAELRAAAKENNGIAQAVASSQTQADKIRGDKTKEETPIGVSRKRARNPELPLPDNWVPSDKNLSDAIARGFSQQEIQDEADRFRNHHIANDTRFRNWDAGWLKWLGNARRFANGRVVVTPFPRGGGQGRSLASIAAQRRASDPY
jgi:hypothetical protein